MKTRLQSVIETAGKLRTEGRFEEAMVIITEYLGPEPKFLPRDLGAIIDDCINQKTGEETQE